MEVDTVLSLRTERFPQEIFETVIDNIDTNVGLHSATLVCRSWLPRASLHLLRSTSVNYIGRPEWWSNSPDGIETWRACEQFLAAVKTSERLQRYVQEVVVVNAWTCTPKVIALIIGEVPHLESLFLRGNCDTTTPAALAAPEVPVSFSGTLRLDLCSPPVLVYILRAFTRLKYLRLNPVFDVHWAPQIKLSPWRTRVEQLTLEGIDFYTVVVIETYIDHNTLQNVTLLGPDEWDPDGVEMAIPTFTKTLIRFKDGITSLSINSGYYNWAPFGVFALLYLNSLTTLELVIPSCFEGLSHLRYFFAEWRKDITKSIRSLHFVSTPATFYGAVDGPGLTLCDSGVLEYLNSGCSVDSVTWTLVMKQARPSLRNAVLAECQRRLEIIFPEYLRGHISFKSRSTWEQ
ncbi:uncharacterized protein PHACADRAFT_184941 [Phanerochaete carnosa HHB-10118-sp]|uniref:F-box domain-containing protein n=1 Tax=Phanerochaete carnosa (strain HHB-10118-sp) TaxID=650164 RepID=K5UV93_PHACS|nr:uncharacterized protein PHACADRAFT_184941 [Phanerochaete carnosa HHB-10118-sp]EKM53916.1 hypothetical protein PHACADRAFT_184941 [Phanerochaete carnosa HHB-10118-sp]